MSSRRLMQLIAVLLMSTLPVLAEDGSKKDSPATAGPFAAYDALLSDTASRTLEQVQQSNPPVSEMSAQQPVDLRVRQRSQPRGALSRVEQLRPLIEPILRDVGVPTNLAAVVMVESGGDPDALSPKGARGLWQLMPDTARRYGLMVDGQRDERLDILKSTRAAAEYLRDLFAQFHSWPLALAAYNAGEQAVQRAMARTGSAEFSVAATHLPRETQDYVPAVLAFLPRFSLPSANRTEKAAILYAVAGQ